MNFSTRHRHPGGQRAAQRPDLQSGKQRTTRDRHPEEQEKILKFSTLLTNTVIFHTTLDMMMVIRELIAEGWTITLEDLAVLSPYLTANIQRFGEYATDEVALTPEPFDSHLELDLAVSGAGSAA